MLGVVKSNLQTNSAALQRPSESFYKPIEHFIQESASGKGVPKAMDADVFAKRLVKDVLHRKSGQVWRGNMADVVKWTRTLLPRRVFDGLISDGKGLGELAKAHQTGYEVNAAKQ